MDAGAVLLTSLDQTVEQVSQRLVAKQNAALVAAPGCGSTTLLVRIRASLTQQSADIIDFDLTAEQFISNSIARLSQLAAVTNNQARVLVIDHAARLAREDLTRWFEAVRDNSPRLGTTCLWVGQLDSRLVEHDFGFQLHSSPRSHVSFPLLPRHDALAAYRCIAESHGCKWGEAILFLLLDFCGNDLALVESATEYLYGDWSSKLYDTTVWDRVARWLAHSARVQEYRALIRNLSDECKRYLTLVRLGGKPLCRRQELLEEVDNALRTLCLNGLLIPNLLPGFYQIRNLTTLYLVREAFSPEIGHEPELLFRRMTNERVSQLLQDVESMLRYVLLAEFQILGGEAVENLLKARQTEGEFMSAGLNKAMLDLATETGGQDLRQKFSSLLGDSRREFKEANSVWQRVLKMIEEDDKEGAAISLPKHLRSVEYLTLSELADTFVQLITDIFPKAATDGNLKNRLTLSWRESLAKVRRLRNRAAHLRNVEFQDIEDLVSAIEGMRKDIINYCSSRS